MIGIKDDINCRIKLAGPVTGYGFLGRRRKIEHIHLALDDAESFLSALNRGEQRLV
ncbi:hypothetical protein [Paenibacillus kobensis]|uniref:hypothetical protein n=1 Tax=Paenibacillus kobensis TaxID=59841 RepID=UPI0013E2AC3B|nr:hypothetical protein [Paenibacillus kobensis]